MKSISTWFASHKVFILGALGAAAVALQQFLGNTTIDYKALGFAVAVAIISYFAKNLKGQASSIVALLGTILSTIATTATGTKISWEQIAIQAVVALIGVLSTGQTAVVSTPTTEAAKVDSVKAVGSDVVKTS